jgi:hypothetical protein
MTTLNQLEAQLRASGQFWRYATRAEGPMPDQAKVEIALSVLNSGKTWCEGLATEFASRQYPPGYSEDDDQ